MTTRHALMAQSVLLALVVAPACAWSATPTVRVGTPKRRSTCQVQAAVDALRETGGMVEIGVGTWREKLVIAKPNVKLIGKGTRPQDVERVWGDSRLSAGGTGKSAAVWASGHGLEADDVTIRNDYDLTDIGRSQAVALRLTADRAVIENVRVARRAGHAVRREQEPGLAEPAVLPQLLHRRPRRFHLRRCEGVLRSVPHPSSASPTTS